MRIAFLGQKSFVIGERGGGIEQHVAALSTRLAEQGHAVTVYARARYTQEHPRRMDGVRIRYPWTLYRKNTEAIIHVMLATLDVLFRRVDVVHYHGVGPALLCWVPRLLRPDVTVVVTVHALDRLHQKWSAPARAMLRLGEWMACRIPHATIAVSHQMQLYCRTTFHAETIYIPNGATPKRIRATDRIRALGLQPKQYVFSAGRLVPVKGYETLIRAFRAVNTDHQLVIAGAPGLPASYAETLKGLARTDTRIRLVGFQNGETLEQLFGHAALYCNSSTTEGLSLSVLEAMGYGVAVLATDVPGNVEAMHETGFTFTPEDVADLTTRLEHLLTHPSEREREGARGQEVIRRYFQWDRIAEQTVEVYRSARH